MRPRRGRPRSEKAREAILEAALDLFVEGGLDGTSMDAIAERAGVSKATIYRWWRSKPELALDALYREWDVVFAVPDDDDSLRAGLLARLLVLVRRADERPYGRVIAALIATAHTDPEFAEHYRTRFVESRRAPARALIQRAIARGEVRADPGVEVVLDMIYGPVYHRLLHSHAALDEAFVVGLLDTVLRGLTAAPNPAARQSAGPKKSGRR